jgi:hypothetical protein
MKEILITLKARFEKNMHRHKDLDWNKIQTKIESNPTKLNSLAAMESTGGEPDAVGYDKIKDAFIFMDCSTETPVGRRNTCYDLAGLESRKEFKPEKNAIDLAKEIGIEILNEEQYRLLQQFGPFDSKTSSWILTPPAIRKLGGALFGDYRYGQTFIYHNGAQSYYSSRGFRGVLWV